MEATVSRGFLHYQDEKGSYSFPIGRRGRKCLAVLDQKEGQYRRSLEMDLFTGFVYYCVDNATTGGLSYYYDMSSKKVGHFFIHRYLRNARFRGFTASPLELEIFEKLPCDDWEEQMKKIPGWEEAIDHRVDALLLPQGEPLRLPQLPDMPLCRDLTDPAPDSRATIKSIVFEQSPAEYHVGKRQFTFLFQERDQKTAILHRVNIAGNEFFGENEEYVRILSEAEEAWIKALTLPFLSGVFSPEEKKAQEEGWISVFRALQQARQILAPLPVQEDGMLMRKITIRTADERGNETETAIAFEEMDPKDAQSPESSPEKSGSIKDHKAVPSDAAREAKLLYAALRGLLRREVEVCE